MPKPILEVTCPECRGLVEVYKEDLGGSGACPVCGATVQFPQSKKDAKKKPADPRPSGTVSIRCQECKAALKVKADLLGKTITCPKCKRSTVAKSQTEAQAPVPMVWEVEGEELDPYYIKIWHGCIYPGRALGDLLFFVIGIPVVAVLCLTLGKFAVAYVSTTFEDELIQKIGFGVVVLAAILAMGKILSFACSLFFALTRGSSWGARMVPLITDMSHTANLYAVTAWAAFYFGPPFLLAHWFAGEGETFHWSFLSVAAMIVLLLMAPMGFLCSATVHSSAGLNYHRVIRGIRAIPKQYSYLLMVNLVAALVYWYLGWEVWARASARLGGKDPSYGIGIPLQLLAAILFVCPAVVATRCLGLLVYFHGDKLPFRASSASSNRGVAIPRLLTAAGCIFVGYLLFGEVQTYAEASKVAKAAERHMGRIAQKFGSDEHRQHPRSEKEFLELIDPASLVADGLPLPSERYGFRPLKENSAKPQMIWVYEKSSFYPDGKTVHVLRYDGSVRTVSIENRDKILEIQKRYLESDKPDQRETLLRDMQRIWITAAL